MSRSRNRLSAIEDSRSGIRTWNRRLHFETVHIQCGKHTGMTRVQKYLFKEFQIVEGSCDANPQHWVLGYSEIAEEKIMQVAVQAP